MDLWIIVEKDDDGKIIAFFNQEIRNVKATGTVPELQDATIFNSRQAAKVEMGQMITEWSNKEFEIVKVTRKITIVE